MVALMPARSPEQACITALTSLYVTPERRGRGIGTQLCAEAARAAAGIGLAELFLYTRDSQRFYADRGWRRECEAVVLDDPARPEVTFMRLALHSTED
jgi:N-acetylglutamate synthase-like GNAT family acetyltransferase